MLEYWNDNISIQLKDQLYTELERNKARNVILNEEITEIAGVFKKSEIKRHGSDAAYHQLGYR